MRSGMKSSQQLPTGPIYMSTPASARVGLSSYSKSMITSWILPILRRDSKDCRIVPNLTQTHEIQARQPMMYAEREPLIALSLLCQGEWVPHAAVSENP